MEITTLNPVESFMDIPTARLLLPAITVDSSYWKPGRFKKERIEYEKKMIISKKKTGVLFYTGLIPRIQEYAQEQGYSLVVSSVPERIETKDPSLPGITFRKDQVHLIDQAVKYGNGVLNSPTGSGKTILLMGILSCYNPRKFPVLILAHTSGIVNQTAEELRKFGFTNVSQIGGGITNSPIADINIGTIQSVTGRRSEFNHIKILLVDEVHRVVPNSQYERLLSQIKATIRIGLTATPPTDAEKIMLLEGLIGPIIGEVSVKEASELEIIAIPKIKIIKLPVNHKFKGKKYQEVISHLITCNAERNSRIIDEIESECKKEGCSLTFVEELEHQRVLQQMAEERGLDLFIVNGSIPDKEREEIKEYMEAGKINAVVATRAWREGINIKSITKLILGAEALSVTPVIQTIGRGLRRGNGKSSVVVVDFFDSSNYHLVNHFGERITLYMDLGWEFTS